MTNLKLKQQRQPSACQFSEWQPWLVAAWCIHFVGSILSISYGLLSDDVGRKYIPINVEELADMGCYKGFVDVFSSSMDSLGALACCRHSERDNPSICNPPPPYLLFAKSLTRFPEAWLLPLFPFLLRGACQLLRKIPGTTGSQERQNTYAKRRFYLYIFVILTRGFILYLLFEAIEELFVSSPDSSCWYDGLLHSHYGSCQGRVSDFSDHVVFYFAQILPIALTEFLQSCVEPFWGASNHFIPVLLLLWLGNLYSISFLGAYTTALHFHTGPEVFIGYIISLMIQVPLFLLQCTPLFSRAQEYFFGHML